MSESTDERRKFLKSALASMGAAFAVIFAGRAVAHPMVREMANRASKTSFDNRQERLAALCDKASCNPGCQDGCENGCQSSCKTNKA